METAGRPGINSLPPFLNTGTPMAAKAQDSIRETKQKLRFGFGKEEHKRDEKYDAFYGMPIDFKTRNTSRGAVSTKRKFKFETLKEWENTLIVVSDYEIKEDILQQDYLIFPEALEEWRREVYRKLCHQDRASYYCLDEVDLLRDDLVNSGGYKPEHDRIFEKLKIQMHLNDPAIPKRLFSTEGREMTIQGRVIKTKYPESFIKVPDNVDKKVFLRETIDKYLKEK